MRKRENRLTVSRGVEMVREIRKREEVEIQREIFGIAMEEDLERGGNISFIPFQKRRDAEIFGMTME